MSELIGISGFICMFILMLIGVPIYISIFIPAVLGTWLIGGFNFARVQFMIAPFYVTADYTYAVVPMFILMGILTGESGLAFRAYDAASKWLGKYRGGLLYATIVANAIFGACSGVAVAANSVFSKIAIPELDRFSYNRKISLGCVASSGVLATLIPPSVPIVLIAILTNLSIGRALLAGVIPAIVATFALCMTVVIMGIVKPHWFPVIDQTFTWKEKFSSLTLLWPILGLFILILGGMFGGFFPSTVGGAIGAFGVLLYAILVGVDRRKIMNSFLEMVTTYAMVFPLIISGIMFSRFLILSDLPNFVLSWINAVNMSPIVVMIAIIIINILLGIALEALPVLIITLPIFFPVVTSLGYDPYAFCILNIFLGALAGASPPVGIQIFVVASAAKAEPWDVMAGIMPFFIAETFLTFILIFFPSIATWLPQLVYG